MASTTGPVAAAPAVSRRATAALEGAAVLVATGAFAFMAVRAYQQIERLIWRREEILHMLSAAGSLATDVPGRFACLTLGSVLLMLVAEYRPRAIVAGSTAAWLSLGAAGTGAYLLSALNVGSRWSFGVLLVASSGVAALATRTVLRSSRRVTGAPGPTGPSPHARPVLPVVIGVVAGLLAVRASIEPITEWDAIIYHVSFARDWLSSLPGLPHAAGPSVGAELSYNYPALFPSISVALAGALHLSVGTIAPFVSPLAAVTILALLRAAGPQAVVVGWAPSAFLLGSTFFVAYAQWPTAYMLMTLLAVLAVVRLLGDRRLSPVAALCIGLVAETGLIGVVFAGIILVIFLGWRLGGLTIRSLAAAGGVLRRRAWKIPIIAGLLGAPLGAVVVASFRRTGGLFFPWVTWPHAGHLLPEPYWSATQHEILANSYGQFGAAAGSFFDALVGIAKSGLLAPGGLALQGFVVVACGVAFARTRRMFLVGTGVVAASVLAMVAFELVWLRYFVPISVAGAVGLGMAMGVLRRRGGGRIALLAYSGAAVAACLSVASGLSYAIAGPNDRTPTATTNFSANRYSPYESARSASNTAARREAVFGDDSRAWDDVNRLGASGVSVGTFDIRNYYSTYRPALQMDGLAGATITGNSASEVARQLKSHGIDAVFIPSWFWEPGSARHPLADRSPVSLWVGAPSLRAIRVYLPDEGVTFPSVLYAVGTTSAASRVESHLTSPPFSIEGPLSTHKTIVAGGFEISGVLGGSLYWRIAAPVTEGGGFSIRLTTKDVEAARSVTVFEPRLPTLVPPAALVDCTGAAAWAQESTADVAFPGSPLGFAYLDVGAALRARAIRATVRSLPTTPDTVLVRACGDPTSSRGGVFPAVSVAGRIIIAPPQPRGLGLSFDYLDVGRSPVTFNVYDESHSRWLSDVAHVDRCGSRRWLHVQLPLGGLPASALAGDTVQLGPVVTGEDFTVRNLRLVTASTQQTPVC